MSGHKTTYECPAFHNSINKYGWDTIINGFKLLAFTDDLESLNDLEIKFIKQYDSFKNGYNCTEGGGGCRGRSRSFKTRLKHSQAMKTHYEDPKAREKLSAAHRKSYKENPERLKKMSEAMKNHYKDNPEARKKMSDAQKKHWKDPEALKRKSEATKKRHKDHPEFRETFKKYFKDNPDALKKRTERVKAYRSSEKGQKDLKRALEKSNEACRKAVIATNLQTGKTTEYVSTADAGQKLSALHKKRNFDKSSISKCARKKQKKHQGYTFKFVK